MTGSEITSAQEITCQPPEPPRQPGTLGIAEPADDDRRQHEYVADRRRRDSLRQSEAHHQRAAHHGEQPKGRLRPLAAPQHGEDRGCKRQEPDEHDRMGGRYVLQRQCGEQRKADDDAESRDDQGPYIVAFGSSLAKDGEHNPRQDGSDRGASHSEKYRVEIGDGGACRRQRP
jgi:hypothetical protein